MEGVRHPLLAKLRVVTHNVDGLLEMAQLHGGLVAYLELLACDLACIQETCALDGPELQAALREARASGWMAIVTNAFDGTPARLARTVATFWRSDVLGENVIHQYSEPWLLVTRHSDLTVINARLPTLDVFLVNQAVVHAIDLGHGVRQERDEPVLGQVDQLHRRLAKRRLQHGR